MDGLGAGSTLSGIVDDVTFANISRRELKSAGYDAAELKARTYPEVSPVPCWQTCWEPIRTGAGRWGKEETCLLNDAPHPEGSGPGEGCTGRRLHCSPGCKPPLAGSLREYSKQWAERAAPFAKTTNITCPCGHGG